MKPILFNTDMVRAILDGRKTATRRLVKFKAGQNPQWSGYTADGSVLYGSNNIPAAKCNISPGDILYVRETWRVYEASSAGCCTIEYKAGGKERFNKILSLPTAKGEWKPSIHMPKEAARIFLRVKDVRVERLKDISGDGCAMEGVWPLYAGPVGGREDYYKTEFANLWNSTIKPAEIDTYGWNANPWVWVIEFERISKQEAMK